MGRPEFIQQMSWRRMGYMGFAALLVLILLGGSYSLAIFQTLKEQAESENLAADKALAEIGAQFVADHQKGLLGRLEGIAGRNAFKNAVQERDIEDINSFLRSLAQTLGEADTVFLADPGGKLLQSLPQLPATGEPLVGLPNGPYRPSGGPRPWVSPVHRGLYAPYAPVVTLSAPLEMEGGAILAYLALSQRTSYWIDFFSRFSARPGRVFHLFDQLGNLVAMGAEASGSDLEGLTRLAQQMRDHQMRQGSTVASLVRLPHSPAQAFVCAAPVSGLGWVLVVSHDYAQAMASSRAMFKNIVFFLVLLLGCLVLLGFLLLSRYRIQQGILARLDEEARRLEDTVRQRTADLEHSNERYRSLMSDLPDIVYEMDAEGRMTFVNDAVETTLGYRPQEMVGRMRRDFVLPEDRPKFDEERTRAEQGERMSILAMRHQAKDGRVRWLSIHSRGLYDEQGRMVGRRGVARDVTQQVLAERRVRELSHRLINAQEEERKRVALDLHDEMGQLLSALKIGLQSLGQQLNDPERRELEKLIRLSQKIMDRIRALAYHLRPAILDNFGLVAALEDLCDSLAEAGLIEVGRQLPELDEGALSAEAKTALFRFVQEALTNVVKHAGSPRVEVAMLSEQGLIKVTVRDFGQGFNPEQALAGGGEDKHLGLLGMQERMRLVGGNLDITSGPEGSTLSATVPLGGS